MCASDAIFNALKTNEMHNFFKNFLTRGGGTAPSPDPSPQSRKNYNLAPPTSTTWRRHWSEGASCIFPPYFAWKFDSILKGCKKVVKNHQKEWMATHSETQLLKIMLRLK